MSDLVTEGLAQLDKELGIEVPDIVDDPEPEPEPEEPAEEAPEPEPETEEPAEEEPEEEIPLLAGKFKTPDELERAYAELQSRMGEQGSELGELRKLVEERLPAPEEDRLEINQPVVDWFDEQVDSNPHGAALWALQNDPSGHLYERAMENWYEIPGQARKAAAFERALDAQALEARLQEQTKPLQAQAEQQSLQAAWAQASSEIPDLAEYAEAIVTEAKESPEILRGKNTLEEKAVAIHKLYRLVKGAQATSVATASEENAKQERETARNAKLSGTAASQTKAVVAETISDSEDWLQKNLDEFLNPYMGPEDQ